MSEALHHHHPTAKATAADGTIGSIGVELCSSSHHRRKQQNEQQQRQQKQHCLSVPITSVSVHGVLLSCEALLRAPPPPSPPPLTTLSEGAAAAPPSDNNNSINTSHLHHHHHHHTNANANANTGLNAAQRFVTADPSAASPQAIHVWDYLRGEDRRRLEEEHGFLFTEVLEEETSCFIGGADDGGTERGYTDGGCICFCGATADCEAAGGEGEGHVNADGDAFSAVAPPAPAPPARGRAASFFSALAKPLRMLLAQQDGEDEPSQSPPQTPQRWGAIDVGRAATTADEEEEDSDEGIEIMPSSTSYPPRRRYRTPLYQTAAEAHANVNECTPNYGVGDPVHCHVPPFRRLSPRLVGDLATPSRWAGNHRRWAYGSDDTPCADSEGRRGGAAVDGDAFCSPPHSPSHPQNATAHCHSRHCVRRRPRARLHCLVIPQGYFVTFDAELSVTSSTAPATAALGDDDTPRCPLPSYEGLAPPHQSVLSFVAEEAPQIEAGDDNEGDDAADAEVCAPSPPPLALRPPSHLRVAMRADDCALCTITIHKAKVWGTSGTSHQNQKHKTHSVGTSSPSDGDDKCLLGSLEWREVLGVRAEAILSIEAACRVREVFCADAISAASFAASPSAPDGSEQHPLSPSLTCDSSTPISFPIYLKDVTGADVALTAAVRKSQPSLPPAKDAELSGIHAAGAFVVPGRAAQNRQRAAVEALTPVLDEAALFGASPQAGSAGEDNKKGGAAVAGSRSTERRLAAVLAPSAAAVTPSRHGKEDVGNQSSSSPSPPSHQLVFGLTRLSPFPLRSDLYERPFSSALVTGSAAPPAAVRAAFRDWVTAEQSGRVAREQREAARRLRRQRARHTLRVGVAWANIHQSSEIDDDSDCTDDEDDDAIAADDAFAAISSIGHQYDHEASAAFRALRREASARWRTVATLRITLAGNTPLLVGGAYHHDDSSPFLSSSASSAVAASAAFGDLFAALAKSAAAALRSDAPLDLLRVGVASSSSFLSDGRPLSSNHRNHLHHSHQSNSLQTKALASEEGAMSNDTAYSRCVGTAAPAFAPSAAGPNPYAAHAFHPILTSGALIARNPSALSLLALLLAHSRGGACWGSLLSSTGRLSSAATAEGRGGTFTSCGRSPTVRSVTNGPSEFGAMLRSRDDDEEEEEEDEEKGEEDCKAAEEEGGASELQREEQPTSPERSQSSPAEAAMLGPSLPPSGTASYGSCRSRTPPHPQSVLTSNAGASGISLAECAENRANSADASPRGVSSMHPSPFARAAACTPVSSASAPRPCASVGPPLTPFADRASLQRGVSSEGVVGCVAGEANDRGETFALTPHHHVPLHDDSDAADTSVAADNSAPSVDRNDNNNGAVVDNADVVESSFCFDVRPQQQPLSSHSEAEGFASAFAAIATAAAATASTAASTESKPFAWLQGAQLSMDSTEVTTTSLSKASAEVTTSALSPRVAADGPESGAANLFSFDTVQHGAGGQSEGEVEVAPVQPVASPLFMNAAVAGATVATVPSQDNLSRCVFADAAEMIDPSELPDPEEDDKGNRKAAKGARKEKRQRADTSAKRMARRVVTSTEPPAVKAAAEAKRARGRPRKALREAEVAEASAAAADVDAFIALNASPADALVVAPTTTAEPSDPLAALTACEAMLLATPTRAKYTTRGAPHGNSVGAIASSPMDSCGDAMCGNDDGGAANAPAYGLAPADHANDGAAHEDADGAAEVFSSAFASCDGAAFSTNATDKTNAVAANMMNAVAANKMNAVAANKMNAVAANMMNAVAANMMNAVAANKMNAVAAKYAVVEKMPFAALPPKDVNRLAAAATSASPFIVMSAMHVREDCTAGTITPPSPLLPPQAQCAATAEATDAPRQPPNRSTTEEEPSPVTLAAFEGSPPLPIFAPIPAGGDADGDADSGDNMAMASPIADSSDEASDDNAAPAVALVPHATDAANEEALPLNQQPSPTEGEGFTTDAPLGDGACAQFVEVASPMAAKERRAAAHIVDGAAVDGARRASGALFPRRSGAVTEWIDTTVVPNEGGKAEGQSSPYSLLHPTSMAAAIAAETVTAAHANRSARSSPEIGDENATVIPRHGTDDGSPLGAAKRAVGGSFGANFSATQFAGGRRSSGCKGLTEAVVRRLLLSDEKRPADNDSSVLMHHAADEEQPPLHKDKGADGAAIAPSASDINNTSAYAMPRFQGALVVAPRLSAKSLAEHQRRLHSGNSGSGAHEEVEPQSAAGGDVRAVRVPSNDGPVVAFPSAACAAVPLAAAVHEAVTVDYSLPPLLPPHVCGGSPDSPCGQRRRNSRVGRMRTDGSHLACASPQAATDAFPSLAAAAFPANASAFDSHQRPMMVSTFADDEARHHGSGGDVALEMMGSGRHAATIERIRRARAERDRAARPSANGAAGGGLRISGHGGSRGDWSPDEGAVGDADADDGALLQPERGRRATERYRGGFTPSPLAKKSGLSGIRPHPSSVSSPLAPVDLFADDSGRSPVDGGPRRRTATERYFGGTAEKRTSDRLHSPSSPRRRSDGDCHVTKPFSQRLEANAGRDTAIIESLLSTARAATDERRRRNKGGLNSPFPYKGATALSVTTPIPPPLSTFPAPPPLPSANAFSSAVRAAARRRGATDGLLSAAVADAHAEGEGDDGCTDGGDLSAPIGAIAGDSSEGRRRRSNQFPLPVMTIPAPPPLLDTAAEFAQRSDALAPPRGRRTATERYFPQAPPQAQSSPTRHCGNASRLTPRSSGEEARRGGRTANAQRGTCTNGEARRDRATDEQRGCTETQPTTRGRSPTAPPTHRRCKRRSSSSSSSSSNCSVNSIVTSRRQQHRWRPSDTRSRPVSAHRHGERNGHGENARAKESNRIAAARTDAGPDSIDLTTATAAGPKYTTHRTPAAPPRGPTQLTPPTTSAASRHHRDRSGHGDPIGITQPRTAPKRARAADDEPSRSVSPISRSNSSKKYPSASYTVRGRCEDCDGDGGSPSHSSSFRPRRALRMCDDGEGTHDAGEAMRDASTRMGRSSASAAVVSNAATRITDELMAFLRRQRNAREQRTAAASHGNASPYRFPSLDVGGSDGPTVSSVNAVSKLAAVTAGAAGSGAHPHHPTCTANTHAFSQRSAEEFPAPRSFCDVPSTSPFCAPPAAGIAEPTTVGYGGGFQPNCGGGHLYSQPPPPQCHPPPAAYAPPAPIQQQQQQQPFPCPWPQQQPPHHAFSQPTALSLVPSHGITHGQCRCPTCISSSSHHTTSQYLSQPPPPAAYCFSHSPWPQQRQPQQYYHHRPISGAPLYAQPPLHPHYIGAAACCC